MCKYVIKKIQKSNKFEKNVFGKTEEKKYV